MIYFRHFAVLCAVTEVYHVVLKHSKGLAELNSQALIMQIADSRSGRLFRYF